MPAPDTETPRRPKPLEPLAKGHILTAEWLNAALQLQRSCRIVPATGSDIEPEIIPEIGTLLRLFLDRGFWIKITGGGTGGKYAWTLQDDAAAGTFTDTGVTGTTTDDPAWETTLNEDVADGTYVRAWRGVSTGEVRFTASACT